MPNSVKRISFGFLALLLFASTLVLSPFVAELEAQDYVEWECNGIPILMRGGVFHYINPDPAAPGELQVEAISGTSGIWNSTAHDPLNNLVYGVGSVDGEKTVRAYDATGAIIFETQIQDPYPDDANTYAGTVLGDGRYIIHSVGNGSGTGWYNGERFNLWSIDTATGAATYIGPTSVNFADFAYNPLDGYLYQAVNRVLYQVDPNTGATTSAPTSTVLPNGSFGASWFDAAGNLYLFRNSPGDIWKVDPIDPSIVTLVGEVGANGGTDGTNCVSSIDMTKDVIEGGSAILPDDRTYSAGDTVTYEIELINNGVPTQNRIVDLCDVLPAGMTYTGVWSSSDAGATISSGLGAGDTNFCAELDMPSSLFTDPANPGSPPTTFTFEVLLGDDIVPGEHENQATLDFDQDGTADLLSDDPGDGSDPRDPTTIEVLGSFTVSKTVVGHPVDNNTDEFSVTLSCTAADGSTHDVDASQILDSTTGAAWPGATTNGFTMSNGDEIEVTGLPAGTTCVTTEDSSTSYTSTVVVEDGTAPGGDTGGGDGAISTGTLTGDLVNDNCQDGNGNAPFNLQVRNTTGNTQVWETIWRNRPYDTIPNLNPGNYTHTVVPAAGGLFDHVFTGTTPLGGYSNITITGDTPVPAGSGGCGDVENYNGVTGGGDDGGTGDGGGEPADSAELTIDSADESLAFTNATSTIDLRKGTSVGGDLPLDEDGTFTFDLSCTNGFAETVTITTSDGSESISYPDTPLLPAGVECTVSENVPAGWVLTTPNDVAVTTEAGTSASATFLNERQLADLTVSKTILGLPDGVEPTSFEFEVTVTCVGGFDPNPYTVTSAFAVGSPFVIEDLPVGTECTVVETPVDGFNIRYAPGQVVEIDADGEQVQVTNSTGSLIIEKTTSVPSTHPIDPVGSFEFTLDCSGPGGSSTETYVVETDSLITDGATGGVSHTDVGVIAPGTTCEVTETDPSPEWTVDAATQTIEITDDDPEPTASFVNTRNTGSLTVTKTIDGLPAGVDLSDEPFTVDVSCIGGFTANPYLISGQTITANTPLVIDDLPTGAECTVTEQDDPRFTMSGSPSTVTIDTDGETVAITNTTSSIEFDKLTVASDLIDDADATFGFELVCTFGGEEIVNITTGVTTVDGQGTATAADLPLVPPGSTCTLTELFLPGWTITNRVGPTLVGDDAIEFTTPVVPGDISFENTLDSASLTIDKDVTGISATPALEAETFTVTVDCTGNFDGGTYTSGPLSLVEGTSLDIDGLPVGAECTVTETADARFGTSYAPGQTFTIVDGANEVLIENETSTFTISKATTVPVGVDPDATFEFAIECTIGGVVVYTDTVQVATTAGAGSWDASPFMAPGTTCSVVETAPTGWAAVGSADLSITTSGSAIVDAAFTNTRDVAELTITKGLLGIPDDLDLDGDPATSNDDEEFTVNVSCIGDFAASPLELTGLALTVNSPLTIPDLPTGTECTVTEDFDSRFQALYSPENADGSAAVVTIGDDGAAAGITNAGGVLAIRKDTLGPADHPLGLLTEVDYRLQCDTAVPYDEIWTVDVNQISGGQGIGGITWTELPVFPLGTECTITEIVPDGWTLTSPNPQVVTVQEEPETTEWVNTRDVGALTVTKTLDGVPAGTVLDDEPFTVDVSCTGGGLTVDPYEILGEPISVNTPLVIDNLPTGATCDVTETANPRFSTSVDAPVDIAVGGETINVTNTTSTFSISKTTEGPVTHPIALDATFTFDTECVAPNGDVLFSGSQTITTDGQAGSWATPDSPLLPPGTTCAVTEQAPPTGWTNTSGATQTIVTDSAVIEDAPFTNERDIDSLTIAKNISGSPTDLSDEPFTVDVSCTGDFTTSPYELLGLVVTENTPIVIPDLPTGAACVVTELDDPRFLPSYGPDDATAIIGQDGSTVDIDNRTGTFIVEKQVDVAGSQPIDMSGTFLIDVSCTDGTAFTLAMNIVDGVATTTETGDVPLLPEGTGCTVTEQTPPTGWTLSTPNDVDVIISSFTEPTISFTNTRDTADLNISKTVIGAPDGLDVAALTFTVDVSCAGDFARSPLLFADQPITDGETITIPDLPTGAVCTVIEDVDPRFAVTTAPVDAPTAGVEITDTGADVAIVNATGEIMIVKNTQVTSDLPVDITETFTFAVDCGAAYTGTHTVVADTITSPTTATGFVRYDDLPALPDGTACTITEQTAPTGWTLTSPNDVALTVDSAGVVTAAFTNERDVSTLTVTKTLDGVPAGTVLDAELFDVTITCAGGFTTAEHVIDGAISVDTEFVVEGIPTGAECSVVETADARFSTIVDPAVDIDADGETINVTNTTSTFTISKATEGPTTSPIDLDATFTFNTECVAPDGTILFAGTQTITTSNQTGTWATPATPLLPPGTTCEISEDALTGWTPLTASPVTITTDSAGIAEAAFTNERDAGSLTVTKTLDGVPAGTDLDAELFDVTITCAGGFTTATHTVTGQISVNAGIVVPNLPTGADCSVVETPDPRFSTSVDPAVDIDADGEAINVTNTTSTLSITKVTEGPTTQPLDLDATFTFNTECVAPDGTVLFTGTQTITTSDQTGTWATPSTPLLPPGTSCEVTEQTPPTGWTNTSGNIQTITTDSAAIADAEFTNERDTGDLNVTKTVIGAPDNLDVASLVFTVDISCVGDFTTSPLVYDDQPIGNGGTFVIADLPTGAVCTVTEDVDPRFEITTTPVDAPSTGVPIIEAGTDVAIVNATGEIMIVKNTQVESGLPVDVTESFDFVVDCGATYTGTHTVVADTITSTTTATGFLRYTDLPVMPNGTDCTITEQAAPTGWTLVSANPVPLTVDSAGVVAATFTNERDTGELTITKTLDGIPSGTDLDAELFEVTVTCVGGFTTPEHVIIGEFSVDAPLTITALPTGTDCAAVETADSQFSTVVDLPVDIDADGETINITNTTSTFSISKATEGPETHPIDLDDTFTFAITCAAPDGTVLFDESQTITTTGQAGTWATPNTPLLPPGSTCEISEDALTGWTPLTASPVTITTDSAEIVDAAFTNERDTGELVINKVLEGVPAGTDLDAELFDVTITCVGGFTSPEHIVTGQISVDTSFVIEDLPTESTCSAIETPDARFSTVVDLPVNIGSGGEELDVTNTTSTFSISKATEGPDTHPLDLDATFAFDVTCFTPDGTLLFGGIQTIATTDQTGTWATPATPLLPPGTTCEVTEQTPPTGWTNISGEVQTVTTDSAEIADAAFTNERDTDTLTITSRCWACPKASTSPRFCRHHPHLFERFHHGRAHRDRPSFLDHSTCNRGPPDRRLV